MMTFQVTIPPAPGESFVSISRDLDQACMDAVASLLKGKLLPDFLSISVKFSHSVSLAGWGDMKQAVEYNSWSLKKQYDFDHEALGLQESAAGR